MSLRSLSDQEILSRIHELTTRERSLIRLVLLHLNEIERRRLHLKLGYASMFDYCTSGLGYSSSAAARRIRTARCVARFPDVLAMLEANEVNLSTVSQVSRVLSPENKETVLARIRGKSQREVDAIVAEYAPRAVPPPDRVRAVAVRVPATPLLDPVPSVSRAQVAGPNVLGAAGEAQPIPNGYQCRSGSATRESRSNEASLPGRSTVIEKRMLVTFSASERFMNKLDKIRSLAWHRFPANPSLEQVFELAMDCFIEKEDPAARQERRKARKDSSVKMNQWEDGVSHGRRRKRHVAAAVRDDVFVRDKGRCAYVGADGRRCMSTHALQIDHVQPVAFGGSGMRENLRLLCAHHNRLEAERILGFRGKSHQ